MEFDSLECDTCFHANLLNPSSTSAQASPKTILVTKAKSKNIKKKKKISFAMDQDQPFVTSTVKEVESNESLQNIKINLKEQSSKKDEFASESNFMMDYATEFQSFIMIPEQTNENSPPKQIMLMKVNEEIMKPKMVPAKKTVLKSKNPVQKAKIQESSSSLKSAKFSPISSSTNIMKKKIDGKMAIGRKSAFCDITKELIPGYGLSNASMAIGAIKSPYQRFVYPNYSFHRRSCDTGSIPLAFLFPDLSKHINEKKVGPNSESEAKRTNPVKAVKKGKPNSKVTKISKPKLLQSSSSSKKSNEHGNKVTEMVEDVSSFQNSLVNMSDKKTILENVNNFLTRQQENLAQLNSQVEKESEVFKRPKIIKATTNKPKAIKNLEEKPTKPKTQCPKKIIKTKVVKKKNSVDQGILPTELIRPPARRRNYSRTIMLLDYDKFISDSAPEDSNSVCSSASSLIEEQRLEAVFNDFLTNFAKNDSENSITLIASNSSMCSRISQLSESILSQNNLDFELEEKSELNSNTDKELVPTETSENTGVEEWLQNALSPFRDAVPESFQHANGNSQEIQNKYSVEISRPFSPDTLALIPFEPHISSIKNISIAKPLYKGSSYERFQVMANFATPLFKCDNQTNIRCLHVCKPLQNNDFNFFKSVVNSFNSTKYEEIIEEKSDTQMGKAIQLIPFPKILPNQLMIKDKEEDNQKPCAPEMLKETETLEQVSTQLPRSQIPTQLYNITHKLLTQVDSAITGAMSLYYDDFLYNCLGEYVLPKPKLENVLASEAGSMKSLSGTNGSYCYDSDEAEYEGPEPNFTVLFEKPNPPNLIPVLKKFKSNSKHKLSSYTSSRRSNRVRFSPNTKNVETDKAQIEISDSGTETEAETDIESTMATDYDSSDFADITKYIDQDELLPKSLSLKPFEPTQSTSPAQQPHPTNPFLPLPIEKEEYPISPNSFDQGQNVSGLGPIRSISHAFRNPLQTASLHLTKREINDLLTKSDPSNPKIKEFNQEPSTEDSNSNVSEYFDSKIEPLEMDNSRIGDHSSQSIVEEFVLD